LLIIYYFSQKYKAKYALIIAALTKYDEYCTK